jgi:hypothetical protein
MADIGTLTPEQMLQQQQILRQQKMAEMLMQKGMEQPQGQMISGRYVAPSIFQNLAGLANTYVGQKGIEKGEQAQLDLAKAIRAQESTALADYMNQLQGKSAVPEKVTEMAGPYTKNVPMPTATMAGQPAVEGNPLLANMNALQNPNAPAFLRTHAMAELVKKPKWEKAEYTDEKTGVTRQGVIDVNSPNPISTFQVGGTKPEMSAHDKAMLGISIARARDEGIINYGAPSVGQPTSMPMGMPQGQLMNQPQVVTQNQPTLMPPLNVAGLSPKAAREAQAEQAKNYQENVKNAYEVAKIFPAIEKALPNAHGSGIGNIMGGVANFVGYESNKNAADAELKVMSDKLLKAVPRFSGPQSDKDVQSYKEAAGSIGDASLPMNVRMAALNTIKELNKPYAPNLNWQSQAPTQPEKVSLGASPMYATNGNQRIVSNDGGKTWQPAR